MTYETCEYCGDLTCCGVTMCNECAERDEATNPWKVTA